MLARRLAGDCPRGTADKHAAAARRVAGAGHLEGTGNRQALVDEQFAARQHDGARQSGHEVDRVAGIGGVDRSLRLGPGARVVSLSSAGHRFADVDLEDPNFEHTPYAEFTAYGRSKTANTLFAVEFDRRHKARGVRAAAVHPGAIQTELSRYMTPEATQQAIELINKAQQLGGAEAFQWKTIPQGAATSVWAGVVAPADEIGGKYCENCHVSNVVPDTALISPVTEGVRGYALDPQSAEALWKKSEEMVGEKF